MPKRNSFFFFMLQRKTELVSEGIRFPRGLVDVAQHINQEWVKLPPEEKAIYQEMADDHNAILEQEKLAAAKAVIRTPTPEQSFEKFVSQIQSAASDLNWEGDCMKEIQVMLRNTLKCANLAKMPILILTFSTYNDMPREELLVAEVGLVVFTIQDGIIENFSALIDPGPSIPGLYSESVTQSAVKLALPFPGYDPRAQNYAAVLERIFYIGRMYSSNYNGLVTFHCLQKNWVFTEICVKWLLFRAETTNRNLDPNYSFNLIPLDIIIPIMTAQNTSNTYESQLTRMIQKVSARAGHLTNIDLDDEDDVNSPSATILEAALEEMRLETETFAPFFPAWLPSNAEDGIFTDGPEVAVFLDVDNYAYHEQLACEYHGVRQDGIYYCPLNQSNRYAYTLLHVLVASFKTPPQPGTHYPTLQTSRRAGEERARRLKMLRKWQIFSTKELAESEAEKDKELVEAREIPDEFLESPEPLQLPRRGHIRGYIDYIEEVGVPIWEDFVV